MNAARLFVHVLLCASFPLAARDFVRIPAQFYDAVDQRTGIKVHLRIDSFLISPTEVTEQEFESVMGFNPSQYRGANLPVENVSWWDAIRYCNLRSVREHLHPAYDLSTGRCDHNQDGYRLPTEAEWEIAAAENAEIDRNKIATLGSSDTKDLAALMHLIARGPSAVATRQPNRWGLYDMLGNVWEWCQDFFDPVLFFPDANNPHGPASGIARVIRGGSFASSTSSWSKEYRSSLAPQTHSRFTGFRVCRTVTPVCISNCEPKKPNWGGVYQQAPAGSETSIGKLAPLVAASATREQWTERATQLKQKWNALLGACPAAIASPAAKIIRTVHDAGYTGTLASLNVEPNVWEDIFVMRPGEPSARPRPAVIVPFYDVDPSAGHDLGGRRFAPPGVRSFALLAVQRGYIAVAVRWFGEGEGESYSEAVANLALGDPGCTGLGKWVSDAHILINYVAALPDVDPQRIGIIGHSLGGKMALYAAAFDPRIAVTVSSEPGIGFSHSNYDDYWYFGKRLQDAPPGTDQHELLGLIAPRPFLLIGGDTFDGPDSWHYINAAREVYRLYGRPGAIGFLDHHQGHSPTPEAAFQAIEWLRHYLE
jgi:formylglycine-generating enzyme required for sulfatase activity